MYGMYAVTKVTRPMVKARGTPSTNAVAPTMMATGKAVMVST